MMFANLNRYEQPEFLKLCPEIEILTPERKFLYRIFSVEQASSHSPASVSYTHLAAFICRTLGCPCLDARPFVLEGGSIHSDGEGTLIVTEALSLIHI